MINLVLMAKSDDIAEHRMVSARPLPTDAAARKAAPVYSGCLAYFPDALVAVAELSRIGNEQHNPGSPLHWDRSKSGDEADALVRHLLERGTLDSDGVRHSAKVAWRALAMLQKEIELERGVAVPAPWTRCLIIRTDDPHSQCYLELGHSGPHLF